MADNTKTYTANVEVETKGAARNMDLLNKTISTSLGEFENLNEAIGKTQDTLGKIDPKSAQFKELSKELAGLKDRLRDTEAQSLRFTEALANQPGVIGLVGQSIEGLRGTLKVFMANPIIAVVTAIAGAFLLLKESLERTEEGQAKLTKITEGFTKILNGLFAIIEPIAMQLADLVIGLLENEKVMDGLSKTVGVLSGVFTGLFGIMQQVNGFVINVLVDNFKTLIGVAQGAGDVIAGVFTFDWDRIKKGATSAFDTVKKGVTNQIDNVKQLAFGVGQAVVDGYKAGEEGFKKGFSRLTEKQKEAQKKSAEEEKRRKEKAAEEEKRRQETAEKILLEAQLSLLSDRDRKLKERELRFQEDLKALKAAGVTDLTAFEEEYRLDTLAINKQYDDEELKRQQEANQKALDEQKKKDEEAKKLKEEYDKFIIDSEKAKEETLKQIQDLQVSNIQQVGGILSSIAGKNKKLAIAGLVIEQGANIAKVVIDTARAISAASAAAAPFIANPITAIPATANLARVIAGQKISAALSIAGIVAGAAKGIAQINQAQIPGQSGGGSAPSGGGVSIPTPPVPSTSAPVVSGGTQNDPTSLIRQTISGAMNRPLRAYVVSQDISSTQALDRRTNTAATFG